MPKQQSSSNASAQAPLDNRPRRPSAEPAQKPLVLLAPCLEASPRRLRATVLSHETSARDIGGTSELILPEIWRRMIAQENEAVEKSHHSDFLNQKTLPSRPFGGSFFAVSSTPCNIFCRSLLERNRPFTTTPETFWLLPISASGLPSRSTRSATFPFSIVPHWSSS